MSHPASAPGSRLPLSPAGPSAPDGAEIAAAVVRELRERFPGRTVSRQRRPPDSDDAAAPATAGGEITVVTTTWPDTGGRTIHPVLVSGTAAHPGTCVVAAAVDDDASPGRIVRYAAAQARRLGVSLRVVHVWNGRDAAAARLRTGRCDVSHADRLLTSALYDHLRPDEAAAAEREILHDRDAGPALTALSTSAALVVVSARSRPAGTGEALGSTVRALVGRTACPLVVLPPETEQVTTDRCW